MSLWDEINVSDEVDTSPSPGDEVKTTTCYMCACRCGIRVTMQDGKVRFIQGNPDHPTNRGVLCAKGSAGAMNHYSPARLRAPLKRVGPRGSGEFQEISWDEALAIATDWLSAIRRSDPRKLAFFTGRDQSQALTAWWASRFGTPNYAAHGGFCSVNMAAGGMYTIGGSFWEFGEPDWDRTKYFLMFGVAEDHDSNPIKLGLGRLKAREATKFVSVNPIRTGYSALADEWIGIRPGTDGALVLALIHELLKAGKVDFEYLVRYTNAPWLVIEDPGADDDGLFARDEAGHPLAWDKDKGAAVDALAADIAPALVGRFTLADGRRVVPVFELMARRYLSDEYSPAVAAERTGVPAATIRRLAAELAHVAFERQIVLDIPWTDCAGRRHERLVGRPVSMHAMRGISAHSNGFHTCRAIHILQMLLGSIDCPGGFRYRPPYPKPVPPTAKPAGRPDQVAAERPLAGMPLGFPTGPQDLVVDAGGEPCRIDKAFSWEYPIGAHGMMHMVIANAWKGDPYPIDTLFLFMANMAWNSAMNTSRTIEMLTDRDPATGEYRIPHIIYSDAFYSETVPYADLVLPDTTYLERWDCISLLDRPISDADGAGDAIRQPVVAPDRDVRPFQDVLIDLGARLGLPGLINKDGTPKYPGGYRDYILRHERDPGVGLLAGWRGEIGDRHGRGAANPQQIERYVENGCYWHGGLSDTQKFMKFANKAYLEWAVEMGFLRSPEPIILQIYSEPLQKFRLAARGHGAIRPPERLRARVATYCDPLPLWYRPFESAAVDPTRFPLFAVTQRPMAMYHAWGSQNAWLRQILGSNRLYLHPATAARHGLVDGDWAWVESHAGRVKVQVGIMEGVNPDVVWTWNAIGKKRGAWKLAPDSPEFTKGFLLNHVISELLPAANGEAAFSNSDPVTGQAAWYDLRVRIEKAKPDREVTEPTFASVEAPPGLPQPPDVLRYGAAFRKAREGE